MPEHDALIGSYVHMAELSRSNEALRTLKKVASIVKPIMRARNWKVKELAEFYPTETNLLGVNWDKGRKICLRLRYPGDRTQFLPLESVLDTMLHELCHIVHGHHHTKFHALWDQLRDEHLSLQMKGYTGEGFLSDGKRLGGAKVPSREARRLAREAAEKRRRAQQSGKTGSGQRLGGPATRPGKDIRKVIADAAEGRSKTLRGCGTDKLSDTQIQKIADTATRNGFRTQAEEDDANEAAIAQALWELVQEDEQAKYGSSYIHPSAEDPTGNGGGSVMPNGAGPSTSAPAITPVTIEAGLEEDAGTGETGEGWSCAACTLRNPPTYLTCDACGGQRSGVSSIPAQDSSRRSQRTQEAPVIDLTESPPGRKGRVLPPSLPPARRPTPLTWNCRFCTTVMEQQWWTCSTCGRMKESS